MAVTLDEAGDDQATLEIDDLGVGSDVYADFPVATDGDDLVALDGDSLSFGQGVVDSDDHTPAEHEVGCPDRL